MLNLPGKFNEMILFRHFLVCSTLIFVQISGLKAQNVSRAASQVSQADDLTVTMITYNIRYANAGDGEHAWKYRKADVINLIKFHKADLFGLQEVLEVQLNDLTRAFQGFDFAGVGRDDGVNGGEYSPVFYNTQRFRKLEAGHFWLSETPEEPSFGWDAACRRICTWVRLKEIPDGEEFFVFNTHFDHRGKQAREESAKLILDKIESLTNGAPTILMGDFNLSPGSEPVNRIRNVLNDSFEISELEPHGSVATWSGFTYNDGFGERIDYIFVRPGIQVKRYAGLTDSRNGHFFSDHLPVLVEISF